MGGREGRREEKEVLGCATSGRKLRARDSGRSRVFRRSASRLAATGDLVRGVLVLLVLSLLFRDLLFTCLLGRHMRLELCRWLPLTATAQHSKPGLRVSSQPRLARRTAPVPRPHGGILWRRAEQSHPFAQSAGDRGSVRGGRVTRTRQQHLLAALICVSALSVSASLPLFPLFQREQRQSRL